MQRLLVALSGGFLFASAAQAEYVRSKPGNDAARAEAYCNMVARGARQGFIAFGDPNFVAGAALGSGIGNAIRQAQTKRDCMTALGFEWVRPKNAKKQVNRAKSDRQKP